MELPLVKVPDWRRDVAEGEEELLLAAALETVYLLELSHILQVGLDLSVRRATQAIMENTLSLTDQEETLQINPSPIVSAVMENI